MTRCDSISHITLISMTSLVLYQVTEWYRSSQVKLNLEKCFLNSQRGVSIIQLVVTPNRASRGHGFEVRRAFSSVRSFCIRYHTKFEIQFLSMICDEAVSLISLLGSGTYNTKLKLYEQPVKSENADISLGKWHLKKSDRGIRVERCPRPHAIWTVSEIK